MRTRTTNPRVLLCSVYRRFPSDYWDIVGEVTPGLPRASTPRRMSLGLRFIKQNVPEVEILEYPLWHEYVEKLKEGWDVVGFSFYQNEIGEIKNMIAEARRRGIRELWAGNFGALDYGIPGLVDRVFTGPAEDQIARVFGHRVPDEAIEHPVAMMPLNFLPGRFRYLMLGLLYTERGCAFDCPFCQTPVFEDRRFNINLESIERVLRYYKKKGITDIFLMDELFGISPAFADSISRLLARYRFRWWAQSRASIFTRNLDIWYERGLRFPLVGVEAINQNSLDSVNKKQTVEVVKEFARRSREKPGMYRMAYTMIGYEDMTVEQTLDEAATLKATGFDAHTISILTPLPRTPLWTKLDSKYGIFDRTWRHYDAMYLVWNHPRISPAKMRYLRIFLSGFLNKPVNIYGKGFSRLIWGRLKKHGLGFIWRDLIKGPIAAALIDDRKKFFF